MKWHEWIVTIGIGLPGGLAMAALANACIEVWVR